MDGYMTQLHPSLIAGEVHRPVGLGRLGEAALRVVAPSTETGIQWWLSAATGVTWYRVTSTEPHPLGVRASSTPVGSSPSWRRFSNDECGAVTTISCSARRSFENLFVPTPTHSTSSTNAGRMTRQQTLPRCSNTHIAAVHSSSVNRIFGSRRNDRSTHVGEGPPN